MAKEKKKDALSMTLELKKRQPIGAMGEDLSLEEAEILTHGHDQSIRDWLQVIYAAGYQISRTTSEF